jgi:hypothetical protein
MSSRPSLAMSSFLMFCCSNSCISWTECLGRSSMPGPEAPALVSSSPTSRADSVSPQEFHQTASLSRQSCRPNNISNSCVMSCRVFRQPSAESSKISSRKRRLMACGSRWSAASTWCKAAWTILTSCSMSRASAGPSRDWWTASLTKAADRRTLAAEQQRRR